MALKSSKTVVETAAYYYAAPHLALKSSKTVVETAAYYYAASLSIAAFAEA